jgi:hypothetical protein
MMKKKKIVLIDRQEEWVNKTRLSPTKTLSSGFPSYMIAL